MPPDPTEAAREYEARMARLPKCPDCGGSGNIRDYYPDNRSFVTGPCARCHGTGRIAPERR